MILVDTSVVMDFLRLRDARFREAFVDNEAAICGITRAEVLHGARNEIDRRRLLSALDAFPHVPMPDELWDRVGTTLATLRAAGPRTP